VSIGRDAVIGSASYVHGDVTRGSSRLALRRAWCGSGSTATRILGDGASGLPQSPMRQWREGT